PIATALRANQIPPYICSFERIKAIAAITVVINTEKIEKYDANPNLFKGAINTPNIINNTIAEYAGTSHLDNASTCGRTDCKIAQDIITKDEKDILNERLYSIGTYLRNNFSSPPLKFIKAKRKITSAK